MGFVSDAVDTRYIQGKSAIYAYRDFGVASSSPPLVLLTRFSRDHGSLGSRVPGRACLRATPEVQSGAALA